MKRVLTGTVTSAKAAKTLRVEIDRRFRHKKYGKIVRGRTVCSVHDESSVACEGDLVEIIEYPPRSKTKRWDLVRVVKKFEAISADTGSVAAE